MTCIRFKLKNPFPGETSYFWLKINVFMNIALAPFWVKYVGIGFWASAAILGMIGMVGLFSPIMLAILMTGLYCLIISREKAENGRVKQIRYEALLTTFRLLIGTVMSVVLVYSIFLPEMEFGIAHFSMPALFAGLFFLIYFHGKIWFGRDSHEFLEEET